MSWLIFGTGGAYLGLLALLFLRQRKLIYAPDRSRVDPAVYGLARLACFATTTEDGLELTHLYCPPRGEGAPVVVLFHGNAGQAGDRVARHAWIAEAGLGLLLAEYRGYGGNPGRPSERGLFADARSVIEALRRQGIAEERMILYGESLGSGVAVATAAALAAAGRPVRGVILEAPFTSLADAAQRHYWYTPAKWLVRDRYNSLRRVAGLQAPLLVLHGTADRVVPYRLGRRLFERAAEPKRMLTLPGGGHSDLHGSPSLREAVAAFLGRPAG